MKNVPIRHHYIPQFILRNFCFDHGEHLHYYDKKNGLPQIKKPLDIFMERNLYRDEVNYPTQPVKIETNLSRFECDIAPIIKKILSDADTVTLSVQENEMLKLFIALMSLRSKAASNQFKVGLSGQSKLFYSHWQEDCNMDVFWKRNLGSIAACRSLDEVIISDKIDAPFKVFMQRDVYGLFGTHLSLLKSPGPQEFVIGDCYPVVVRDNHGPNIYSIVPISPNREILMVNLELDTVPRDTLQLRPGLLTSPRQLEDNYHLKLRARKLFPEELEYLNQLVIENAEEGIAYRNR